MVGWFLSCVSEKMANSPISGMESCAAFIILLQRSSYSFCKQKTNRYNVG